MRGGSINRQFIQSIIIDWNKIERSSYLREVEALKNLKRLEFSSPVTFFVGENGSGKSTMLEALAVAAGFNPEGGTKNYRFSTYDSHSITWGELSGHCTKICKAGWVVFFRRAGGGAFTAEAVNASAWNLYMRQAGSTVFYCESFTDFAGTAGCRDFKFRRRSGTCLYLWRDGQLSGDEAVSGKQRSTIKAIVKRIRRAQKR